MNFYNYCNLIFTRTSCMLLLFLLLLFFYLMLLSFILLLRITFGFILCCSLCSSKLQSINHYNKYHCHYLRHNNYHSQWKYEFDRVLPPSVDPPCRSLEVFGGA